ncbi:MAG: hypothetical protein WAQ22_03480 [Candidatus Saccharimonas sp.]
MIKKSSKKLLDIILIAISLALSVGAVVLSTTRAVSAHETVIMLSIGLACLSVYVLDHAASK